MPQVIQINTPVQSKSKLRVAAYCRVSSSSADQLNSYARQIRTYTDLINKRSNWELVDIFADEGITGTKANKRPEFQRMIHWCELKKIDLIITKSVSRFARNVKEALEYVRKLKQFNVGVQFEKEGINTLTLADEMLINTFAAIAQEESVAISQHLKLANRKRMEDGEYKNPTVPYGFQRINQQLVPYEPEAKVVKMIFTYYLKGFSTAEIARELNKQNIPTKHGNAKWRATRISYILSNEKNVGDSLYQKTFTTDFPFKRKFNRGEEDQFYTTETHEPIISKEIFDKVQILLSERQEKNARKTQITDYPFTGILRCEECGSYFRRRVIRGRERWGCAKHITDSNLCDSHYIQLERLESGFISIVNKLRFGKNILSQAEINIAHALQQIKRNNEATRQISQEIATINSELLMLEQVRNKGYMAADIYHSKTKEMMHRLKVLKENKQFQCGTILEEKLKKIQELKSLINEIEVPESSFNEKLFRKIVISGSINKNDEMTLEFIGGLKFTEII